jgi:hypothetical protein
MNWYQKQKNYFNIFLIKKYFYKNIIYHIILQNTILNPKHS